MAHASTREKGILQMKRVRKARNKRLMEVNSLTPEERIELEKKRNMKTNREKIDLFIWDHSHGQVIMSRKSEVQQVCSDRELELKEEEEQIKNIDDPDVDKKFMFDRVKSEKEKIITLRNIIGVK